jgi:hypothetical protein
METATLQEIVDVVATVGGVVAFILGMLVAK